MGKVLILSHGLMSDVPRTKAAKKRTVTSKAMLAVIDQLQKLFLKNINGVMLHTSRTLNLANMQSASNADLYVKLITSLSQREIAFLLIFVLTQPVGTKEVLKCWFNGVCS